MTSRNIIAEDRRGAAGSALASRPIESAVFVALAVGVLSSDAHQAAGYELSIYGGTPVAFCIGVGTALAASLLVSFSVGPGRLRTAALVLGGTAVTAIAGLPVLRGYHYHGAADALTHLGWAREMATGGMAPAELFYPGIHSFAVMLPLSLATVFPSPFTHKQTQHVTEPQMDGYRTVFDVNDEALPPGGIRQGPWRYRDAIEGVPEEKRYEAAVTNENLTRLAGFYDDGGYLVVTDRDRGREVRAYEGLRYTERTFRSLDAQRGVNRVVSNGALRLYHAPEGDG